MVADISWMLSRAIVSSCYEGKGIYNSRVECKTDHELKHIKRHHIQRVSGLRGLTDHFFESYRQDVTGNVMELSAHLVQDSSVDLDGQWYFAQEQLNEK